MLLDHWFQRYPKPTCVAFRLVSDDIGGLIKYYLLTFVKLAYGRDFASSPLFKPYIYR